MVTMSDHTAAITSKHVVSARFSLSRVADLGKELENNYWIWEILTYKDEVAVSGYDAELAICARNGDPTTNGGAHYRIFER